VVRQGRCLVAIGRGRGELLGWRERVRWCGGLRRRSWRGGGGRGRRIVPGLRCRRCGIRELGLGWRGRHRRSGIALLLRCSSKFVSWDSSDSHSPEENGSYRQYWLSRQEELQYRGISESLALASSTMQSPLTGIVCRRHDRYQ
jgi:hypothetical protein